LRGNHAPPTGDVERRFLMLMAIEGMNTGTAFNGDDNFSLESFASIIGSNPPETTCANNELVISLSRTRWIRSTTPDLLYVCYSLQCIRLYNGWFV